MKILIIEDENAAARRLTKLISEIDGGYEIVDILDSIEAAIEWFSKHDLPDVLLLDIHLADGSSFKIFDHVEVTCPVIFVTAYDEYAVQAFRVNAIDYLMKPIKKVELEQALSRVRSAAPRQSFDELIDQLRQSGVIPRENRVLVRIGQNIKLVDLNAAAYFYTEDKITFAVMPDAKRYPVEYSLDHLDGLLNDSKFFRINRQFIVNVDAIQDMYSYSKSRVKMNLKPPSHVDVIVSTERSPKFKKWLTGSE
ncbi:MAG: LytTR family DNA-binding domain-containing protein [Saprospiraceae bacterium]|nr:LytTR family DNA-binding domain-containing protein [Saprospiraceae bacterium]